MRSRLNVLTVFHKLQQEAMDILGLQKEENIATEKAFMVAIDLGQGITVRL